MKNNLHANPLVFKMIVLFTCFMLVILYNKTKAAELPTGLHTSSGATVNFKHDVKKDQLTIRIKSGNTASMQLFIFSADGILIEQITVGTQKITIIPGLKRGYYLYECFYNDKRMNSGNLVIN